MAKVYRAPMDPPPFRRESWREDEANYIKELAADARSGSKSPLVGEIIRFQVADGYAQYMIWRSSPLELVHINTMDGYSIPEAHARGLRLADVKAMVERDKAFAAMFPPMKGAS